jgi:hypothetical protein
MLHNACPARLAQGWGAYRRRMRKVTWSIVLFTAVMSISFAALSRVNGGIYVFWEFFDPGR